MTVGYGLGMLLVGLIAITIGGTIIYIVINKLEDENDKTNRYNR